MLTLEMYISKLVTLLSDKIIFVLKISIKRYNRHNTKNINYYSRQLFSEPLCKIIQNFLLPKVMYNFPYESNYS